MCGGEVSKAELFEGHSISIRIQDLPCYNTPSRESWNKIVTYAQLKTEKSMLEQMSSSCKLIISLRSVQYHLVAVATLETIALIASQLSINCKLTMVT